MEDTVQEYLENDGAGQDVMRGCDADRKKVGQVREVCGEAFGECFVAAMPKDMDKSAERVIQALLDHNIPPNLMSLDRSAPLDPSPSEGSGANRLLERMQIENDETYSAAAPAASQDDASEEPCASLPAHGCEVQKALRVRVDDAGSREASPQGTQMSDKESKTLMLCLENVVQDNAPYEQGTGQEEDEAKAAADFMAQDNEMTAIVASVPCNADVITPDKDMRGEHNIISTDIEEAQATRPAEDHNIVSTAISLPCAVDAIAADNADSAQAVICATATGKVEEQGLRSREEEIEEQGVGEGGGGDGGGGGLRPTEPVDQLSDQGGLRPTPPTSPRVLLPPRGEGGGERGDGGGGGAGAAAAAAAASTPTAQTPQMARNVAGWMREQDKWFHAKMDGEQLFESKRLILESQVLKLLVQEALSYSCRRP